MHFNEFQDVKTFKAFFQDRLEKKYIIPLSRSSNYQRYVILGLMIRDHIAKDWQKTNEVISNNNLKQVYYFSMEFLMGRMITNNLINSGLSKLVSKAFSDLGYDLNEIEHMETDAGLGNGGLGRLAACFMDSVASLGLPVHGNCLRYRYGFFEQGIKDGYQIEMPDNWLKDINVWEVRKEEKSVVIPFYGQVEIQYENNQLKVNHIDCEFVKAVPYDLPIIGNQNNIVNTLRLWSAEPTKDYPASFEYYKGIREISSMLYPNDEDDDGKILRLKQQYLFSSAGVVSALRKHKEKYCTLENLPEYVVFHINDTHPALIVAELMRILIDEENFEWDLAWDITTKTCAYTNHTILAEALEKWPVNLFKKLLPRVYMIIEEINRRFCEEIISQFGHNHEKLNKMAIIANNTVRMASLAIVGSFSVNGVAQLHTDILKNIEMQDFHQFYPNKFNNKTNGITHRRWCYHINPELVEILKQTIGNSWIKKPEKLKELLAYQNNNQVLAQLDEMKKARKKKLAQIIKDKQGLIIDSNSIFDIQVKRLHEYKRQLMNALHIIYLYDRLKNDLEFKNNYHPTTFIFGAKAAPSYFYAKKIIKLINTIADKVNNDLEVNQYIKVVFAINYNVTYAESLMPACDISEQISTASKEASGTGNMKFMINGGITLGTMDGANVEIAELVGSDNIIIFGMSAEEVTALHKNGNYNPKAYYDNDVRVRYVLDSLTNGFFANINENEFAEIRDNLLNNDHYFVLKDFHSYIEAHEKANRLYQERNKWLNMSLVNIAMSGFFSTDRTMKDYNRDIWRLKEVKP
ncbi:MAG: glycogen/starch/alpha-glucan phosphorylase [Erysipelotrichales bacterium]|nr:glycogen/starch/alpha-glucan phosphorylase [Erysipelotrichales bacterium]